MNLVFEEPTLAVDRRTFPIELLNLKERIQGQPDSVRAELEPLMNDVMEHAIFGSGDDDCSRRLERLRLDVATLKFDLDATRREQTSA